MELTQIQKDIVIGGLLGDASITKSSPTSNARMRFAQSEKQWDYLMWKYEHLRQFVKTPPRSDRQKRGFCKGKKNARRMAYFNTISHSVFADIYNLFYYKQPKKKRVPLNIQELLTEQAAAVWLMDDGSCCQQISFATYGFAEKGINRLSEALDARGYTSRVVNKKKGMIIRLSSEASRQFTVAIRAFLPECMEYKADINEPKPPQTVPDMPRGHEAWSTTTECRYCGDEITMTTPSKVICNKPSCRQKAAAAAHKKWRNRQGKISREIICAECGKMFTSTRNAWDDKYHVLPKWCRACIGRRNAANRIIQRDEQGRFTASQ